jgi:hypothetical protein
MKFLRSNYMNGSMIQALLVANCHALLMRITLGS